MTSTTTHAAQALGPQTAALAAADATYMRLLFGHGPEALTYAAAIDAQSWPEVEQAERQAEEALAADGIDVAAVDDLGGCGWGSAAIALAARHLIGTGGWTQEAYDMLAYPWRIAAGKLHPDDA